MSLEGLSVRTSNCLWNDGITELEQLQEFSEREMLRIPNFGRVSLNELKQRMKEHGLYFRSETAPRSPYVDKRLRVPSGPLVEEAVFVSALLVQKHKELDEARRRKQAVARRLLDEYYPEYNLYEIANLLGSSVGWLQKARDAEADNTTE